VIHRHPTLYRMLGPVFLVSTMILIFLGAALDWPASTRPALFILSCFPLLLALVYFSPGSQEERGF
jgi:hypothetical protein